MYKYLTSNPNFPISMQRSMGPPACASCKYQRKKCTNKCVLAHFFPAEKAREFRAVHKVFGVSNVTKIITSLKEEERKVGVESLVWEALCRQKDPVMGPYGEYRRVCEELRAYQRQYHQLPSAQESVVLYKAQSISDNGIVNGYYPYGYSEKQAMVENASSPLIQHLGNGFNQQYILTGHYNPMAMGYGKSSS